ncbi:MAG TPA: hypothetical protein VHJ20_01450 [Polyangia bacterium]|nr:hypothetical protein [Polyangia bacterium]
MLGPSALLCWVTLAACGRSPINLAPPQTTPLAVDAAVAPDAPADLAIDLPVDVPVDLPIEMPVEAPDEPMPPPPPPPDASPPVEAGPVCHPVPETCNGVDDNCDGRVDEDLPAIPCPGGGARYCAGGHYSECPRRCETCVPGSERECFTTLCTFWGRETCASDGRSFGPCRETPPPDDCKGASNGGTRTKDLEQCCLDQGLCCIDEFDLDGDGDRTEMLGRCDTVTCDP